MTKSSIHLRRHGKIFTPTIIACVLLAVTLALLHPSSVPNRLLAASPLQVSPCPHAQKHTLPLPSTIPPARYVDFEKQLFAFLDSAAYMQLGWCRDKGVRDTGPWINGTYYGTHPAVRIFYSPEVIEWLIKGRNGALPDGAMIVKEQYSPPAARYAGMTDAELERVWMGKKDWTIMIRDDAGSKDGWYWGEFFTGMSYDDDQYPFNYPAAGFGEYCVRCHASAEKEATFISLDNVLGFRGSPLTFRVDNSWRPTPFVTPVPFPREVHRLPPPSPTPIPPPDSIPLPPFSSPQLDIDLDNILRLPSETYDRVVADAHSPQHFLSSDQCMSCHYGATGPFGPVMWLGPNDKNVGVNVSPYGEWRWTPMGLAGRDPIFYAQLESELEILKTEFDPPKPIQQAVVNLCLTCHGAMGKRQFDIDQGKPNDDFRLEWTQLTNRADPHFKYGALARDGISCTVCHHMAPDQTPAGQEPLNYFLEHSITGQFELNAPDQVFGPFEQVVTLPMENALGITPKYNDYIKSSRLCGSCHTINLPNVDVPLKDGAPRTVLDTIEPNPLFKNFRHSIEQATYLEWLNSSFQTEFSPTNDAQSCQDCHMPGSYRNADKQIDVPQIKTQIAAIEDPSYPAADHRADLGKIDVPYRDEGFVRHELLGMNAFLLEMFNQFNDILGVRKGDYMSGSPNDLADAIDNIVQQANERTAKIELSGAKVNGNKLTANVKLTNLTGHRLPSGVAFRRTFLEFLVVETLNGRQRVVWGSGRTNAQGVITDGAGQPLPSESLAEVKDSSGQIQQAYQPHYQTITSEDQVQIYEELTRDQEGKFTTSFIHRAAEIKDNRLLPRGWRKEGPEPSISYEFIQETHPRGDALNDPQYQDGSGTDIVAYSITLPPDVDHANLTVEATLYSQAIPPYYLMQRFTNIPVGPEGEARRRLYALVSNLDVEGTAIDNWKLRVVSASAQVENH